MSSETTTPLVPSHGHTGAAEMLPGGKPTLRQRAREELISFLLVSGYLFVWFSALLFYKAAILHTQGVSFAPFGLAIVKALILGKFILVLEALRVGERHQGSSLAFSIIRKALLFTVLLVILSIGEDVIVGVIHGQSAGEGLRKVGDGSLEQALAVSVLLCLVLLPYLVFRRFAGTVADVGALLGTRPGEST